MVSHFWVSISSMCIDICCQPFYSFNVSKTLLESHIYHTSLSEMFQLGWASFFVLLSCICCNFQVSMKILHHQHLQEDYIDSSSQPQQINSFHRNPTTVHLVVLKSRNCCINYFKVFFKKNSKDGREWNFIWDCHNICTQDLTTEDDLIEHQVCGLISANTVLDPFGIFLLSADNPWYTVARVR